jgi:hypothetical protein
MFLAGELRALQLVFGFLDNAAEMTPLLCAGLHTIGGRRYSSSDPPAMMFVARNGKVCVQRRGGRANDGERL